MSNSALVSVVIPCYNQAHFLGDAIESVLAQTNPDFDLIVVDDGSTDNTADVAASYPGVRCVQQRNQGLSAARNTGLQNSTGQYLVFLDADDRLLPNALKSGLECLKAHPNSAFGFGRYRLLMADGTVRYIKPYPFAGRDAYSTLLQINHIGMHATVMYRRTVFDAVGGFNTLLRACEDYELYFRVARQFPVAWHENVIAEYRHHGANMSGNFPMMLTTALSVLRRQRPFIRGNKYYERMYRRGILIWIGYYTLQFMRSMYAQLKAGAWKQVAQTVLIPGQYALPKIVTAGRRFLWRIDQGVASRWQRLFRFPVGRVDFGDLRRMTPVAHHTDCTSAKSVERYYIECFLSQHISDVRGRVLEIGNTIDTHQIANGRVIQRDVVCMTAEDTTMAHINNLPSDSVDCIILVQWLHYAYELKAIIQDLQRILKPSGVLLATVSGIGHINQKQQACCPYWSFTLSSARRLFTDVFPTDSVKVEANGNVLAATAVLQGLGANMLTANELDYTDPKYPLLITIRAVKPVVSP